MLDKLEDELRFVLITSYAKVEPLSARGSSATQAELEHGELWIEAKPSAHPKCVRCWHHREDVGSHSSHPELCGRCVANVDGDGEPRHFT